MTTTLRGAIDEYSRDGDVAKLIDALVLIAAGANDLARCFASQQDFARQLDEAIKQLLAGNEREIDEGLALLDSYHRYEICGLLRRAHPSLSAQNLADIWQDALLALSRKALQRTIEVEQALGAIVWAIADRRAKDLFRTKTEQQHLEVDQQSASAIELGRRWQMLTGLQQEEVRDLIWAPIERLPATQKAVWQAYLQYVDEHSQPPTAGQLTDILFQTSGAPATTEFVDLALQIGRKRTRDSLRSNGYDVFTAHDQGTGEECEEETLRPIDRLVSEAFPQGGPGKNSSVPDLRRAESFLTDADRNTLEELPPDLATRVQSKNRTLRMWRSPLWSDRLADTETYLPTRTLLAARRKTGQSIDELVSRYNTILREKRLDWAPRHHFVALLGEGGQGVVYLVRCPGVDGFNNPLALKILAPDRYACPGNYVADASRMARMASIVADTHHPNVLDVVAFEQHDGVRMMLMEWIDGYDLGRLLVPAMLERLQERATSKNWFHLSEVVVKDGPNQPRLRPFISVAIIQSCLAALEKMHERGIVHGDIKPSNIMLTRNGYVKLIDIGSAFVWKESPAPYHCTYRYAAPEVLRGDAYTPHSDLASLGYVLVEFLSGHALFANVGNERELLEAKTSLPRRLASLLPARARRDEKLVELCRRLVEPDPRQRFANACAADLDPECGALAIRNRMIMANLGTSPEHDISHWLKTLG